MPLRHKIPKTTATIATITSNLISELFTFFFWRRGRDSNPRWRLSHNGFQDRRDRPLCHPSGRQIKIKNKDLLPSVSLNLTLNHNLYSGLAGREGLEPPTDGFGDRYSTN